jgi:hypothetical protein
MPLTEAVVEGVANACTYPLQVARRLLLLRHGRIDLRHDA